MKDRTYSVAVVGATGLVGAEIVAVLEQRGFPLGALQLYASVQTAGDTARCGDLTARVELLEGARFAGTDLVFLAAAEAVSAEWTARAAADGAVVIDLTQLHAGDPTVPLVVPEVNAAAVADYTNRRVLATPDPAVVALAVALAPVRNAAGLRGLVATTLEPASTMGRAGVEELQRETVDLLNGRSPGHDVFPQRLAFNAIPLVGEPLAGGSSSEETRAVAGLRRLLETPDLPSSITRVRVPVFFGVGVAATIDTERPLTAAEAQEILRTAPGVVLDSGTDARGYLTPADTVGKDAVCVGRVRVVDPPPRLDLWLTIDNLRKGSAVNAVQIAEVLVREHL
ncbi:aspartate-semialdehyde dehydrogenase [Candidatus Binatia bacterium]|nr:aspartate-semialdehyde dehydrogenase [Candidatus Binatia bacterium]